MNYVGGTKFLEIRAAGGFSEKWEKLGKLGKLVRNGRILGARIRGFRRSRKREIRVWPKSLCPKYWVGEQIYQKSPPSFRRYKRARPGGVSRIRGPEGQISRFGVGTPRFRVLPGFGKSGQIWDSGSDSGISRAANGSILAEVVRPYSEV